jgi:hypothetical protein
MKEKLRLIKGGKKKTGREKIKFTLNNIEKWIDEVIVSRGEEYFDMGAVIELEEIDRGRWNALVEGTDDYNVHVLLKGAEVTDSACDCPYDFGPTCKHEVAVYLAIRERLERNGAEGKKDPKKRNKSSGRKALEDSEKTERKTSSEKIDEIIKCLGFEGLSGFVREYAMEDREFRGVLLSRVVSLDDNANVEDYRNIIRAPINAVYRGFSIENRFMKKAFRGVDEALRIADMMSGKKEPLHVVYICQALTEEMPVVIDLFEQADDEIWEVMGSAFDMLTECAGMLNVDDAEYLFNYCLREARHRRLEGFEDWRWAHVRIAARLASTAGQEKKLFRAMDDVIKLAGDDERDRKYAEKTAQNIKKAYFDRKKEKK